MCVSFSTKVSILFQDKHNSSSDDGGALHLDSSPDAHAPSSAAKEQLKETLRDDIIGTIHGLTQGDFTELLGVYRVQRKQLQNQRDAERSRHQRSLWEILEERKKKSDQHVHAGEDQVSECCRSVKWIEKNFGMVKDDWKDKN